MKERKIKIEKKEIKIPKKEEKKLNIYVCGPTVYDNVHIGNMRPVITFDVLMRTLKEIKTEYYYVQNITDIDDKIIEKSKKMKVKEDKISKIFEKKYYKILSNFNILFPNKFPKATHYIEKMIELINLLLKKKIAYEKDKNIIFDTSKIKSYGSLSGKKIEFNIQKRNIKKVDKNKEEDFAIWKKSEENDKSISWNSENGRGRPGWHTECMTMINDIFKDEGLDIHGGGSDLIFPHHENERAQFIAIKNKEISKIWIHISPLNYDGKKMSKSVGNIFLARKFHRKFGNNILRHIFFSSNYKSIINLNENLINQSKKYIEKIERTIKKIKFLKFIKRIKEKKIFVNNNKDDEFNRIENEEREEIIETILNNINTSKVLFFLEKNINKINKKVSEEENYDNIKEDIKIMNFIFKILGFDFKEIKWEFDDLKKIKKWLKLREEKNYEKADKIRSDLQIKGII